MHSRMAKTESPPLLLFSRLWRSVLPDAWLMPIGIFIFQLVHGHESIQAWISKPIIYARVHSVLNICCKFARFPANGRQLTSRVLNFPLEVRGGSLSSKNYDLRKNRKLQTENCYLKEHGKLTRFCRENENNVQHDKKTRLKHAQTTLSLRLRTSYLQRN